MPHLKMGTKFYIMGTKMMWNLFIRNDQNQENVTVTNKYAIHYFINAMDYFFIFFLLF